MTSKIYIRADGGPQIGLGHLVRCIALAQMLKQVFQITFVCKQIPVNLIDELNASKFGLIQIDEETFFIELITENDIVVLDGYNFDTEYQKQIKLTGCKLVCIDDLHDKEFVADLIINHAPNISPVNYKAQVYTQFALGLDYVLLRPAFLNKVKNTTINKSINTAFICFGGADAKNITQKVVNILITDVRFKKIIVVTGASYNYLNDLKKSVGTNTKFALYHAIDSEKMSDLITEAHLAIVPASGILQEVLAIGCKIVSGIYIENQKNIFNNFKVLDAFQSAESFSNIDLLYAIDESFKNDNIANKKLIDGKSGSRLLEQFIKLHK